MSAADFARRFNAAGSREIALAQQLLHAEGLDEAADAGLAFEALAVPAVQTCRDCGCTDEAACYDEVTGVTCHWVEPGLCSACYFEQHYSGPEPDDAPLVQLYSDADANRAIAAMRAGGAR